MNSNQSKHKEIKFHKANFKNAKKISKIKSSKQILSLCEHNSNESNNGTKKYMKSSSLANVYKNIENKYLIAINKNLIKNQKLNRNSKFKKMNLFLKQKTFKKIEEEKNEEYQEPIKNPILGQNNFLEKNEISKNKIKRCKSMFNKNSNKDLNIIENEENTFYNNSNKKLKIKKEKETKETKYNKNKINKGDKKIDDDTHEKSEDLVDNFKQKFFCCL